eukprot:TRINITY_DN11476_c0_g1_i2.p1 TRINITY_DN11476_c0_g1~~TRINITY_DN11476_c0_g1_i2.p1  ORF type:complete len:365 (-),score=50.57 TRINITY_DN11476_c0_g1_i2:290-1384(-)
MAENLLQVTIVKATDIADVKVWEWGKQDPYAILVYNQFEFRTRVHEDAGKNPIWDETFSFYVESNPVITLTVMHDRKKHDDIIGTAKFPFASAYATGSSVEQIPLFTTEGKQQGFAEVVLKFPSVVSLPCCCIKDLSMWVNPVCHDCPHDPSPLISVQLARFEAQRDAEEAARRMELLRLEEAKVAYQAKLKEATRLRQQRATELYRVQESVIDGSVASLSAADALESHAAAMQGAKTAFLASTGAHVNGLLSEADVDPLSFEGQLSRELEGAEDFKQEISTYVGSVTGAMQARREKLFAAKAVLDKAVGSALRSYLAEVNASQEKFDKSVAGAAKAYKSEALTKLQWMQESKALDDVAAYDPR